MPPDCDTAQSVHDLFPFAAWAARLSHAAVSAPNRESSEHVRQQSQRQLIPWSVQVLTKRAGKFGGWAILGAANLLADDVDLRSVTILHVRNDLQKVKRLARMKTRSLTLESLDTARQKIQPAAPWAHGSFNDAKHSLSKYTFSGSMHP